MMLNEKLIFPSLIVAFMLVMVILSSISLGSASKITDSTEKKNIKSSSMGLLIMSLLLLVIACYFLYSAYDSSKAIKQSIATYYF